MSQASIKTRHNKKQCKKEMTVGMFQMIFCCCNNTNKTQIPEVICYLTNRLDISEEKAIYIL